MPDIRSAMEALTLTNHFTINPPGTQLKLNYCMHLSLQGFYLVGLAMGGGEV